MRIIAGTLGGRLFEAPHGHRTHPMGDKVRGALFNILGDINGLTVLDAFAGSGALSFEAVSRGAAYALMVEADRSAQMTITANIAQLGVGKQTSLVQATAQAWLATYDGSAFDLVLLDPPYANLQVSLLRRLAILCKPNGIMVLSWPADNLELPQFETFHILDQRQYANAQLVFYGR